MRSLILLSSFLIVSATACGQLSSVSEDSTAAYTLPRWQFDQLVNWKVSRDVCIQLADAQGIQISELQSGVSQLQISVSQQKENVSALKSENIQLRLAGAAADSTITLQTKRIKVLKRTEGITIGAAALIILLIIFL